MTAQENTVIVQGNSVPPCEIVLPTLPYAEVLKASLGVGSLEAYSRNTKSLVVPELSGYSHGFVAAVYTAYARHCPLVLSPDIIWLLIVQGFSMHIRENPEAHRNRFVAHQGKTTLRISRGCFVRGFAGNDWENVYSDFSVQIRSHIGHLAHNILVPTFSTTSFVEKAAFEVALLDAMQQYFNYDVVPICGIPSFILQGTPDDWCRVYENAAALAEHDLDWWIQHLLKVLEGFVAASQGGQNPEFWQDFFYEGACKGDPVVCGEPRFQGHIVNFFPYLVRKTPEPGSLAEEYFSGVASQSRRNPYLGKRIRRANATPTVDMERLPVQHNPEEFGRNEGLTNSSLASGLSVAPFTWKTIQREYQMEFIAGFIGMAQDPTTLSLCPEIGWAVREKSA